MNSRLNTLSALSALICLTTAFPLPFTHHHLSLRRQISIPFDQPSFSLSDAGDTITQSVPPGETVLEAPPTIGTPASEEDSALFDGPPPSEVESEVPTPGDSIFDGTPPSEATTTSSSADPTTLPPPPIAVGTDNALPPGLDPTANPPYLLFSLLSTPTTINFLLTDPNPNAPVSDSGAGAPVRCSATFATDEGLMDMSKLPYDRQPCVDVVTGVPQSASLWAWQVVDYAGPGLFVVRVWHGYLDPKAGPCAVQEDGTETFCNTNYYGEHQVEASMGDLVCDEVALSCESPAVIEIPITSAVA